MTPTRPYLVRAFYDWILDNGLTPYLLVDATADGVRVPVAYVKDGRIVLNVAPAAITDLELGVATVSFSARFAGRPQAISLPVGSIMAIYARENGQGMFFSEEEDGAEEARADDAGEAPSASGEPARSRPALRLVK